MLLRTLVPAAILCSVFGRIDAEPYPCYAAAAIPRRDRRFFAFVPTNIRSHPPVECVFLFGGTPGTRLRMSAYDVQTSEGGSGGGGCVGAAIRVYDFGRRGLELMATYCGHLRRGKMLTMSSNMAVVTFTTYKNVMDNSFSLVVDSVESDVPPEFPCLTPADGQNGGTQETPIPSTTSIPESESSEESTSNSSEGSASAEGEPEAPVSTTSSSNASNQTESNDYTSRENATQIVAANEVFDDEARFGY